MSTEQIDPVNGIGYRLSPLETATTMLIGVDPNVPSLPPAPPALTARAALERAVLPALQREPCLVSFSGGRDSSAVLAVATHVARRKGLPLPIPITMRFPGCPEADESHWQELVVRHLELPEWIKIELDHELDLIGPHSQTVMRRHGPLWPFNVHSHLPLAEHAAGGSLMTGRGGDELLTPDLVWRRVNHVLTRQTRPTPRDVIRLATAYGPAALRRYAIRRRYPLAEERLPWLRPDAARQSYEEWLTDWAAAPVRWDRAVDHCWWRTRVNHIGEHSLALVGLIHDVLVQSPLIQPLFLAAMARDGGRAGFFSRTEATRHLVGHLLPEALIRRTSKAKFGGSFWNWRSAAFAASWDGSGVDPNLVNIDALRGHWTGGGPVDARSFGLLQAAWMAAEHRAQLGTVPTCTVPIAFP